MQKATAIILSAGSGRRLLPYTKKNPKCLVTINDLPIIYYQIMALKKNNITQVSLVLGFHDELVRNYLDKNFPDMNFTIIYNPQYRLTNTLYSLALAKESVLSDQSVLIINGDVLLNEHTISRCIKNDFRTSHALIRKGMTTREDVKVIVNKNNQIQKINKEISENHAFGEAVGIYLLSSRFWASLSDQLKLLKSERPMCFYEYAFEKTISKSLPLYASLLNEELAFEIDTPEDLNFAKSLIKNVKAKT